MANHKGTFYGGKADKEYNYEFDKWKTATDEEGQWRESIKDSQLSDVTDTLIVKIENPDTGQITYNSITGPFGDWEIVEELLEYDWGPEGDTDPWAGK